MILQARLHQAESCVADLGILGHARQVGTDNRQVMFCRVHTLDGADALDRPDIHGIATDGVNGVGRVDYQPAITKHLNDLEDVADVGVFVIQLEQHGLQCLIGKNKAQPQGVELRLEKSVSGDQKKR